MVGEHLDWHLSGIYHLNCNPDYGAIFQQKMRETQVDGKLLVNAVYSENLTKVVPCLNIAGWHDLFLHPFRKTRHIFANYSMKELNEVTDHDDDGRLGSPFAQQMVQPTVTVTTKIV